MFEETSNVVKKAFNAALKSTIFFGIAVIFTQKLGNYLALTQNLTILALPGELNLESPYFIIGIMFCVFFITKLILSKWEGLLSDTSLFLIVLGSILISLFLIYNAPYFIKIQDIHYVIFFILSSLSFILGTSFSVRKRSLIAMIMFNLIGLLICAIIVIGTGETGITGSLLHDMWAFLIIFPQILFISLCIMLNKLF